MNNQELIKKWESKEGAPVYTLSELPIESPHHELYVFGYGVARKEILDDLKQLDEPKKVILPKTADEFIKEGLSMGSDKVDIIGSAVSFSSAIPTAEFSMWFKTNGDLLIDALANGYEVEKEPLYYVKLPDFRHSSSDNVYGLKKIVNGEIRVGVFDKQEIGKTKESQLTENQIN
ncbi:DUF1642 domain-containing protein [Enterococcus faecalis]|uniref:DUF1642 domain-containing protein n=1 Tax=Enterococcus faecalis TaxID=1351 RepID=UPI00398BE03A